MDNSKTCCVCKQIKSTSDFNKNKRHRDGLSYKCRICDNASSAKFRAKHPDKAKNSVARWKRKNNERNSALNAAYRSRNLEKYRNYAIVRRTRKMGEQSFVILQKELRWLLRQPCFYCGSNQNQTLDHIIPLARGGRHSFGNLITSCAKCNSTKGARTITEFQKYKRKIKNG